MPTSSPHTRLVSLAWLVVLTALGMAAASTAGAMPLTGLQDDRIYRSNIDPDPRTRLMANLGAEVIRVDLRWDLVARARPTSPRDPGDDAYDWERYDPIVAAARRHRISVLFTVWGTPGWAADPAVESSDRFPDWAKRPADAEDYGDFARAAAARYAPRGVRLWEAWNEPNLPLFLRPQFALRDGVWRADSPRVYAALMREFYVAVKEVDPTARVAGGVTAPVGNRCPLSCPRSADGRVAPIDFIRGIARRGLRPPMDAVAHHPYPATAPRSSTSPGVAYVDLYNLGRLVRVIDRTYLRGRPLWLTEFGFGTERVPEYPFHVSRGQQAAFLADAVRRVGRMPRVRLFSWYLLQDNPGWTSGLLTEGARRKPAFASFALPLAAVERRTARGRTVARLSGQVRPAVGRTRVALQQRGRGGWRTLRRLRTDRHGVFATTVPVGGAARYRVRWAGTARTGDRVSRASRGVTVGGR